MPGKIRFGMVGTGFIADWVLAGARQDARFEAVAICSRTQERADAFAAKHGIPHTFTSLGQMAASPLVDAVYIATPNFLHASQSILCMRHGKHVLCEKPLASNAREARQMVAVARECGVTEEIPEEQQTLEGNASQKAHYLNDRTGLDCFADDTGLEVEALGGAPGVHSARYATDGHDFAANNRLLLKNLEGAENRRARFRTVISLLQGGKEHLFEGIVEGRIIDREAGHEGFGYDPLFVPDGYTKTFAEMTTEEKNAVSHRARAVRKLAAYLHSTER